MEDKSKIIESFDPNGVGVDGALFGLPFGIEGSELIVIPVPWDVTSIHAPGTNKGPETILKASGNVSRYIHGIPDAWQMGIAMLPVDTRFYTENEKYKNLALRYVKWVESGQEAVSELEMKIIPNTINELCEKLNIYVKSLAVKYLRQGKMVSVLGGNQSTSLGLIKALSEQYEHFGVLQIGFHTSLKKAHMHFRYTSHSAMYNVLKQSNISKLVQVGVCDSSDEEMRLIRNAQGNIVTYFDEEIKERLFEGDHWKKICDHIVGQLPEHVYLTFDTGVFGASTSSGLDHDKVVYLLKSVVRSGRKMIGMDLCGIAPSVQEGMTDQNANLGARLLYRIGHLMGVSQGRLRFGY